MRNFWGIGLWVSLGIMLVFVSGCETARDRQLQAENDRLNAINMEHVKETRSLLAQLDSLRKNKMLLDEDVSGLNKQINFLKNKLAKRPRGDVLTGAQRRRLLQIARAVGGELLGNKILLPGDFLFGSGSWALRKEAKLILKEMAAVLAPEKFGLMVVGHTDNEAIKKLKRKGIRSNRHLSVIRALAVVEYLEKYAKYPPKLLYPAGWGELHPVAANTSKRGRARNRRVEIYIDPDLSKLTVSAAIIDVSPAPLGADVAPVAVPREVKEEELVPVKRAARWEK